MNQSHKIGFPRVNTGYLDTQTKISLHGNSGIRMFFEKFSFKNQNQTMKTVRFRTFFVKNFLSIRAIGVLKVIFHKQLILLSQFD